MNYLKLESQRYLDQEIDRQVADVKRVRNQKAIRDFVAGMVGIALIPIAMMLAYKFPVWFPEVAAFLQAGLDEILPSQISNSLAETI